MIKDHFLNFCTSNSSDISIDLATGKTTIYDSDQPNWTVHLVDTAFIPRREDAHAASGLAGNRRLARDTLFCRRRMSIVLVV